MTGILDCGRLTGFRNDYPQSVITVNVPGNVIIHANGNRSPGTLKTVKFVGTQNVGNFRKKKKRRTISDILPDTGPRAPLRVWLRILQGIHLLDSRGTLLPGGIHPPLPLINWIFSRLRESLISAMDSVESSPLTVSPTRTTPSSQPPWPPLPSFVRTEQ